MLSPQFENAPLYTRKHCCSYNAPSQNKEMREVRGTNTKRDGKMGVKEMFANHRKKVLFFKKRGEKMRPKERAVGKKRKQAEKGDRWVSKALVALLGWKRMPLIMRCLFYPPALCLSHCYACFPLAPIISALEPGDNNEFTEIEKCLGLNCMYLVTQTEAMAWERLVSQWHHLATQPL